MVVGEEIGTGKGKERRRDRRRGEKRVAHLGCSPFFY
jgi:hypothetical protein